MLTPALCVYFGVLATPIDANEEADEVDDIDEVDDSEWL